MHASQVTHLREEITAVLANARKGDEVVILLDSGGGSVTGYGFDAAQIERIKDSGLYLTVCVDENCCLWWIYERLRCRLCGVITVCGAWLHWSGYDDALLYDLMGKVGFHVDEISAGEFMRTLVPYKKSTEATRAKPQDEMNTVMAVYQAHVAHKRGNKINIKKVSTGETWSGKDAIKLGLVDRLATSDELLIEKFESNNAFFVKHLMQGDSRQTQGGILKGVLSSSTFEELISKWIPIAGMFLASFNKE